MYILGISAYYHDSAAVLLKDGEIVGAIEEERFSRIKHDNNFPFKAIDFLLKSNSLTIKDIDYVSYYEKPLLKLERILSTLVYTYPRSAMLFSDSMSEILGKKLKVEETVRKELGFQNKMFFVPHHLSHAASTYYSSGFKRSAVLTIDGVGDDSTTELWLADGKRIINLKRILFPHSIGLLYSTFTSFLGFKVNFDEFKVMGLAAYGKPTLVSKVKKLVKLNQDGSFKLDMSYFSYQYKKKMWSKKFEKEFGSPRIMGAKISRTDKDLAASIQQVTEEYYMSLLNGLYKETKSPNLCIAGGVGLNSLANGKIYEKTKFKKVHIFGPAGDDGGSLGAALYTYISILGKKRPPAVKSLYLGSKHQNTEILREIKNSKLKYKKFRNDREKISKTADMLAKGKIVGWFQGQMEFGPRALGARSILANPQKRIMKDKVNKIKRREDFRPFAGSVLQEHVDKLFEVPEKNYYSPYMNFCFLVRKDKSRDIAAIVHEDRTCRIQTVNKDNGLYYNLIREFYKRTGIPCVLNSSFNLSHEPIVESPSQAIWDFLNSPLDTLVMGDFLVSK